MRTLIYTLIVVLIFSACSREKTVITKSEFAGSKTCVECHQKEYNDWKGSDHDLAMDTAIESTVLGNFNNTVFTHNGFKHRFYKKDGRFYVHTLGTGGKAADYPIDYTFGYRPLQQYLIKFNSGRYQCLPIAWDTKRKTWYHLADSVYKGQDIKPNDWLYWTNNGQNWNGMCAECHSTNLQKNYDPKTDSYHTTWSEIDVACEACHGPAEEHIKWAKDKDKTIANYGLIVQTSNISSQTLINNCAYCHSRRSSLGDFVHPRKNLFDIMSPQLPVTPYYFVDGQILEEDYVYASFSQSKMHENNVRCTNCHDPHSLKLKFNDNRLCYQCHNQEKYGNRKHHFHKDFGEKGDDLILANGKHIKSGEGSLCVNCHMPGRYFMGVDFRRDHSMRIPRPDLSDKLGTPNACTECHSDKSNSWAAAQTLKWYGPPQRQHFGQTMFRAQKGDSTAIKDLLKIIDDNYSPSIIKASAAYELSAFDNVKAKNKLRALLNSESPLIKREAIRAFIPTSKNDLIKSLTPLLYDSSLMIRIETVPKLAVLKNQDFDSSDLQQFNIASAEYVKAMEYSADFPGSRHNLGNYYSARGDYRKAIENYLMALKIDKQFYPAKVNLAMTYNKTGENDKAEKLFLELVNEQPNVGQNYYSLGLLQSEMQKYDEAIINLEKASNLLVKNTRVKLNLFKLLAFKNQNTKALEVINQCIEQEPDNLEFYYAKLKFLIRNKRIDEAKEVATKLIDLVSDENEKIQLKQFVGS